jgi:hypothetical protein
LPSSRCCAPAASIGLGTLWDANYRFWPGVRMVFRQRAALDLRPRHCFATAGTSPNSSGVWQPTDRSAPLLTGRAPLLVARARSLPCRQANDGTYLRGHAYIRLFPLTLNALWGACTCWWLLAAFLRPAASLRARLRACRARGLPAFNALPTRSMDGPKPSARLFALAALRRRGKHSISGGAGDPAQRGVAFFALGGPGACLRTLPTARSFWAPTRPTLGLLVVWCLVRAVIGQWRSTAIGVTAADPLAWAAWEHIHSRPSCPARNRLTRYALIRRLRLGRSRPRVRRSRRRLLSSAGR